MGKVANKNLTNSGGIAACTRFSNNNKTVMPVPEVSPMQLSRRSALIKRAEDTALVVIALILLSPLMALISLAVLLDSPGPVLFRQKRYGHNNALFEIFKFRTMYNDKRDDDAAKLVGKNDLRVTRVGQFLRRYSLDELPQLFNVLNGTMSMIGPRPHARAAKAGGRLYDEVVPRYSLRHNVKPGITGWAQVNGWRGETDTDEKIQKRVEFDLYYIASWSVWLDMKIVLLTLIAVIRAESW